LNESLLYILGIEFTTDIMLNIIEIEIPTWLLAQKPAFNAHQRVGWVKVLLTRGIMARKDLPVA
jgi:hypothetical protein